MSKPVTIKQAAEYLGLKVGYMYQLIHHKKIPYFKPSGARVYFTQEDLEAYCFRNRISADYELNEQADKILNKGALR